MTKRELLYPEIKRLYEREGLTMLQIGERLSLARSTVYDYYSDPTGDKARERKARYSRPCEDCSKPLNPNGITSGTRCIQCQAIVNGAERKVWTRDTIVAAIREWADIYGEHPRVCDWNPSHARDLGRALHPGYIAEPDRWPHQHTVMREFGQPGGWAKAIRAAGFEPRRPGRQPVPLVAA